MRIGAIIGAMLMSGGFGGHAPLMFKSGESWSLPTGSVVDNTKKKGGPAHRISTGIAKAKRDATKRKNIQRNKAHH